MAREAMEIRPVALADLRAEVTRFRDEGYRLCQVGATKVSEEATEINYSFDREFRLVTIRVTITPGTPVPSVSDLFFGALFYENEIHDLFGITVEGIALDYKGTFYRTRVKEPFNVTVFRGEGPCQGK